MDFGFANAITKNQPKKENAPTETMNNMQTDSTVICKVAIAVPLYRVFDYLMPEKCDPHCLQPGQRVSVLFGKSRKTGVLVGVCNETEVPLNRLRTVEKILDSNALLSRQDLELLSWASQYYHHPLGEVIASAFPVALRQGKAAVIQQEKSYCLTEKGTLLAPQQIKRAPRQAALLTLFQSTSGVLNATMMNAWHKNWKSTCNALIGKGLVCESEAKSGMDLNLCKQPPLPANAHQREAIEKIGQALGCFSVFLLEGVTGSGKTEIYLQVIDRVLQQGLQALVLLPEISLTPQLEQRFKERFTVPIVFSHSRLTNTERLNAWLKMQQGSASIMLGTRSVLFSPIKKLGLIILDEEHDNAFKQQEGFRYSARDVAVVKAKKLHIPIVLGSATPSLESLHNVKVKRYQLLRLPQRAGNAIRPQFTLLDIRNKKIQEGLTDMLISEIQLTLDKREQTLLFLNRRGYAPVQMCHSCGHVSRCQRCDANLVIHYDDNCLRCHHCGNDQKLKHQCPACLKGELRAIGLGTERIEKKLTEIFPGKKIVRLDRDTTQRKGSLESYLEQINQGQVDIILGTQMLAKGHHFPNVTLVALLDIDSGLFSIDFHSAEKLAQMIVQVSGRAGRAEKRGKVILQTRQPEHPILATLLREGYAAYARLALKERQQAKLPPYSYQALFRVQAMNAQAPLVFFTALKAIIKRLSSHHVSVLGPVPAPMARRAGYFRYQLLLQSERRSDLHRLLDGIVPELEQLKEAKHVRWSLDIDPIDLY